MRALIILASVVGFAAAMPAHAQQAGEIEPSKQKYKCTTKDAVGGWSMVFFNETAGQCSFTVDKDRKIVDSVCIQKFADNEVSTLAGKIVIDKKCNVTADLTITVKNKPYPGQLTAYMTFDQTAFTGLVTNKKDKTFVAVAAVRAK